MQLRPAKPQDGLVWITGASSGIGRAVALEHARRGWTVAATARRAAALSSLVQEAAALHGRILDHPGDVTDSVAMAAMAASIISAHGPIARVILNAGAYLPVRASTLDVDAFRRSFDLNLMGVVNGIAAVLPAMIARGNGQVAITASVAGYGGLPNAAAYGAAKAGLINLAASLKFDLDNAGVLIQIASPGFVKTAATDSNEFPMPFLMDVDAAATRYVDGLDATRFEIVFPRRFAFLLKVLNVLPYGAYFAAVSRATGWRGRKD
jgi:NADP-dependent 3-hydroxy acid dehydrogenase YdfG